MGAGAALVWLAKVHSSKSPARLIIVRMESKARKFFSCTINRQQPSTLQGFSETDRGFLTKTPLGSKTGVGKLRGSSLRHQRINLFDHLFHAAANLFAVLAQ